MHSELHSLYTGLSDEPHRVYLTQLKTDLKHIVVLCDDKSHVKHQKNSHFESTQPQRVGGHCSVWSRSDSQQCGGRTQCPSADLRAVLPTWPTMKSCKTGLSFVAGGNEGNI